VLETETQVTEASAANGEQKRSSNGKRRGPRRRSRHSGNRRQDASVAGGEAGAESVGQSEAPAYARDSAEAQGGGSHQEPAAQPERPTRPEAESKPAPAESVHHESGGDS